MENRLSFHPKGIELNDKVDNNTPTHMTLNERGRENEAGSIQSG
jgi:hypothetical protein